MDWSAIAPAPMAVNGWSSLRRRVERSSRRRIRSGCRRNSSSSRASVQRTPTSSATRSAPCCARGWIPGGTSGRCRTGSNVRPTDSQVAAPGLPDVGTCTRPQALVYAPRPEFLCHLTRELCTIGLPRASNLASAGRLADYKFDRRFDAYAGFMWSHVADGLAAGYLNSWTIDPTIGARFNFQALL